MANSQQPTADSPPQSEAEMRYLVAHLHPGDRIEIDHEVKVGMTRWHTKTVGEVVRTDRLRHSLHFDRNFDEQIKKMSGPVLVDFWAAWCGPCKMIAPSLEQLAGEMEGRATVAKVNVDENGDVANRFGIRSIPTLMIFKEGRVVDQIVGALPKEQIRRMMEKHLA